MANNSNVNKFWKFIENKVKEEYPLTKWYIDPYSKPGFIVIYLTLNINGIGVYSETLMDLEKVEDRKQWDNVADSFIIKSFQRCIDAFSKDQVKNIINRYGKEWLSKIQDAQTAGEISTIIRHITGADLIVA